MKHKIRWGMIAMATMAGGLWPTAGWAQFNSWTSATDGKWENSANWSALSVPTNTSLVVISNALSKTVTLDALTTNNPANLTITSLRLQAPANTTNTLALRDFGT